MENLKICGEIKIRAGEIAEDIVNILIKNGYEIANKSIGYIYNEYEILRKIKGEKNE